MAAADPLFPLGAIYTLLASAGFEAQGVSGRSHMVAKDLLQGLPKLLDLEWKPLFPENSRITEKRGDLQAGQRVKFFFSNFFNEEKNFLVLFLFFFRKEV